MASLAEARAKAATPLATSLGDCHSLIDVFEKKDSDATRARLRAAIRRVVSRVVCLFVARGRSRLGAVQVWFKDTERHRDYLIAYTQGRGNAQKKTPAEWWVRSFADIATPGEFDLRNRRDATKLERALERAMAKTEAKQAG